MLAHAAIDAGAAAVVGHHPHVLQGSEIYKDRLVVYSLGNFAFGSLPSGSDPEGLAVRLFIEPSALRYELVPLVVDNDVVRFRPRPYAVGEEKKAKKVLAAPKACSWSDATLRWTCVLPRPEGRSAYAAGDDPTAHLRR
jgi:poly-gamma-glutamate synthesis protein (capsule biosynthesis protein)